MKNIKDYNLEELKKEFIEMGEWSILNVILYFCLLFISLKYILLFNLTNAAVRTAHTNIIP